MQKKNQVYRLRVTPPARVLLGASAAQPRREPQGTFSFKVVSISLRESSWVCGSFGDRWQFLLQALDPRPPRNNRGHLLLRSAGLKASQTLLPATAEQTSCMAETARPANGLVWTPHRAERFGKQPSTMCGGMEKPGLKKGFLSCAVLEVAPCLLKVGMPEK